MNDPRDAASRYRLEQELRADARARGEHLDAGAAPDDEAPAPAIGPRTAEERAAYVETALQQAIRRGEFDNLPGAGKPLQGLGAHHDPNWWIRRKIEHEQLTGLGPPALSLRVEDAELRDRLDALRREPEVREAIEDFNRRVIEARRQLLGGPPVVTALRDVEDELAGWRERRDARAAPTDDARGQERRTPRRWFRFRGERTRGPVED